MWKNECEREGERDYERYGRPSFERSRYDRDDACYFRGYGRGFASPSLPA